MSGAAALELTVGAALAWAQRAGVDRLDAQMLLAHLLARPRTWLLAHGDAPLDAPHESAWRAAVARRAGGEPLAYVLGVKEFHGLAFEVNPAVLVPRPDTEVLVDWALELLVSDLTGQAAPRVIDLGTGSGAVAISVKHAHPTVEVVATDLSTAALDVARRNAQHLGPAVEFGAGSWWGAARGRRFHLALSNPPYIAQGDPHLAALQHEPALALTPGGDGLSALREIVAGAPDHLEAGGWLLLEHGHDQAPTVRQLLHQRGFGAVTSRSDLAGHARCSGAQWPPGAG